MKKYGGYDVRTEKKLIFAQVLKVVGPNQGIQTHSMKHYLTLAKYEGNLPFTDEAVEYIRETSDGNLRRVLKAAFALFEAAADQGVKVLDKEFVENNIPTV